MTYYSNVAGCCRWGKGSGRDIKIDKKVSILVVYVKQHPSLHVYLSLICFITFINGFGISFSLRYVMFLTLLRFESCIYLFIMHFEKSQALKKLLQKASSKCLIFSLRYSLYWMWFELIVCCGYFSLCYIISQIKVC